MSDSKLICKNDKCRGSNFEQISGNTFKCMDCGTTTTLTTKRVTKKKKVIKKRDAELTKTYSPLIFKCEQCGAIIDRLDHPREEKRLNDTWSKHVCVRQDKFIQ